MSSITSRGPPALQSDRPAPSSKHQQQLVDRRLLRAEASLPPKGRDGLSSSPARKALPCGAAWPCHLVLLLLVRHGWPKVARVRGWP